MEIDPLTGMPFAPKGDDPTPPVAPKKAVAKSPVPLPDAQKRKGVVVAVILVLLLIGFIAKAAGFKNGDDTTPSGLDKAGCMALYDGRVGHDPHDNAFWQGLVECANKGLLPAGQNDPGFYSN